MPRDIKPDNIILKDENPLQPVLVDFGMSFYEGEDQLTLRGQQIGNRFLHLPEFSPGSSDKRNPRSDITQCAGILFYALTNIMPRELRDSNGFAPHQSVLGKEALSKHTDIDLIAMLNIFDKVFDYKIHTRWESAQILAEELRKIKISKVVRQQTTEDIIAEIKAKMDGHEEKRITYISQVLEKAYRILSSALDKTASELSGFGTSRGDNKIIYQHSLKLA